MQRKQAASKAKMNKSKQKQRQVRTEKIRPSQIITFTKRFVEQPGFNSLDTFEDMA